jgi:DNA-binding response OmpR family regulator
MTSRTPPGPPVLHIGPLEVVPEGFEARLSGRLLSLSAAEFRLLAELADAGGAVVRFERLLVALRGRYTGEPPRVLHPFISRVRRAMGAGGRAIEAVPRIGYRLDPSRLEADEPADGDGA